VNDSIYAPPEAETEVADASLPPLYIVGLRKLYLLSVFTVNLYFVYWFYKNWKLTKIRNAESIWPPARGVFYIFFTHSLFTEINELLKTKGKSFSWSPSLLATVIVLLTITNNVLNRLAGRSIGSPITDIASITLVIVIPLLFLKPQSAINLACDDPEGKSNASLGLANWAWMTLGFLWWLLILFGLYAEVAAPELLLE
jgi:hypothetical protein